MPISRRDFLKIGGGTVVASLTACSEVGRQMAQRDLPLVLTSANDTPDAATAQRSAAWRLLNRAGYGPRPGDLERVASMGLTAYVEEQLAPEALDDTPADLMLRQLTLYPMDIDQLLNQEVRDAAAELMWATMSRALYSRRQLYEAMVEFWSDHFNIYLRKSAIMPFLKIVDDRDTIRPFALGKFRDLLHASMHSAAMLVYLDNARNIKGQPNENYARELMELHTLGVAGGYDQKDVQEVARALTGWTVGRRGIRQGQVILQMAQHDAEAKVILGCTLPAAQGEQDIADVLDILAAHPATARFIATKLVQRFVADDPPLPLVEQVATTFQETDGDIKQLLRLIFLSEEFMTAPPKLKRPFTFMVSALRALGADVGRSRQLAGWTQTLGQPLFQWPPPNGYPDIAAAWANNLLPRWNFAQALVNGRISQVTVPLAEFVQRSSAQDVLGVLDLFAGLTLGRSLTPAATLLYTDYAGSGSLSDVSVRQHLRESVALMLSSPDFQWV